MKFHSISEQFNTKSMKNSSFFNAS